MTTKVRKIGNSLGVYIPKEVAKSAGVKRGTPVVVRYDKQGVIIEPVKRQETLADLLRGYNSKTKNEFIDFGPDVGKEIIE